MSTAKPPFVTVVAPVLNEADYIADMLRSLGCLSEGSCYRGDHEILILDGGSTDGTLAVLAGIGLPGNVRVIDNPGRTQSAALNLAASAADARSEILIRVDAHALYPADYVERIVSALSETGADSVVVPLVSALGEAEDFMTAVSLAQRSKAGNGGAGHRLGTTASGWVDHGHHAGFRLSRFLGVGGYDEEFRVNEDAEYDTRLAKAGGKIWLEASAPATYFPRRTLRSLARQYFRYGAGRAATILKHRARPKPRQVAPLAILAANLGALLIAAFAMPSALAAPAAYLGACALAVGAEARRAGLGLKPILVFRGAAALAAMHLSWAAGFACKAIRSVHIIERPRRAISR